MKISYCLFDMNVNASNNKNLHCFVEVIPLNNALLYLVIPLMLGYVILPIL